jgi:predicted metal-dependent enzyme (double-stranded beta helix superfamily)
MHVKNANAGTVTVTITTPGTVDGNAVADKVVTILTTAEKEFVFPPAAYNQPDNATDRGMVYVDFSPFASVSVKATRH